MKRGSAFAILIMLAALPAPAHGAVSVFGSTLARSCYEAARDGHASGADVRECSDALDEPQLLGRDRVATYVNRGILYVRMGNFPAGLADYDRALAIDDDEPDAILNKALALLRRDRSGSGLIPLFDAAIRLGTSEPAIAFYGRGVANELNGDISAAYYDIRRASELAPEWQTPAEDLARFVVRSEQ